MASLPYLLEGRSQTLRNYKKKERKERVQQFGLALMLALAWVIAHNI